MKNAGYKPIIRALATLGKHPSLSASQLHGLMPDVALTTVTEWLRDFERTGLAHIEHVEHVGPRLFVRYYSAGPGSSAHWPHRVRDGGKTLSHILTIAALREFMLEEPRTVSDLIEEVGIDRRVTHRVLNFLHDHNLARIAKWPRDADDDKRCPAWKWGPGRHSSRGPAQSRRVTNRKAWAKRKQRLAEEAVQAREAQLLSQVIAGRAQLVAVNDGCGTMVAAMVAPVAGERRAA